MRPIAKRRKRTVADALIRKLPMDLLTSCILDRIPLRDAARTSILSKSWRNIWQTRSDVLLTPAFMDQLLSGKDEQSHESIIVEAVTQILRAHKGPIVKFALHSPLDIYNIWFSRYAYYWMLVLYSNGIKHLTLVNVKNNYYLPILSCLFSCSELVHLMLANFSLTPPPDFPGFQKLSLVHLSRVKFLDDMSFGPQLNQLSLLSCSGIQHLSHQFTHHNKNLNKFELRRDGSFEFAMASLQVIDPWSRVRECINLQRILCSTPNLATLILNSICLDYLNPEQTIVTRLTIAMENMNTLVLYDVELYDLRHISNTICLIRSSPNLQSLKISVGNQVERSKPLESAAEQYFESLDNKKKIVLEQLHTVEIHEAQHSKAEQLFQNLLRASSPSLKNFYCHHSRILADGLEKFNCNQSGITHISCSSSTNS